MPHLDSLRALAIGAVLLEHWGGSSVRQAVPIGAGAMGVNLFFTLSGFLITSILMESLDRNQGSLRRVLRNFYARRLLRLTPVFYLTVLVLAAIDIGYMRDAWPWHVFYLSNFYEIYGGQRTVFWSLSVEEHFYLLWPLLLALTPRHRLLYAVGALIVLGLLWKLAALGLGLQKLAANILLFGNLETLGMGCALAALSYRDGRVACFDWYAGKAATRFDLVAWGSIALALVSWLFLGKTSIVRYLTNDLLTAIFYAWLVLHAARGFGGFAGRVFDCKALQYVGQISYGIYVLHNYPPDILEKYVGPMPKAMAAPIVVVVTFGVCSLSWHFVEQPIMRLKRYFDDRPPTTTPPLTAANVHTLR